VFNRSTGTWVAEGAGRAQFGDRVVGTQYREALGISRDMIHRQRVDTYADGGSTFVRTVTTTTPVGSKPEVPLLRSQPWSVNVGVGSGGWTEVVTTRTTISTGIPAWSPSPASIAPWSPRTLPSAWSLPPLPTVSLSARSYDFLTRPYTLPPPTMPTTRMPAPTPGIGKY
jgi:hypothetical protein